MVLYCQNEKGTIDDLLSMSYQNKTSYLLLPTSYLDPVHYYF